MSKRITIEELQSYLWNSAVLLRTNIDAGAYKQYIFPLLFFKRICDVYDEETAKAIAEYGDDAAEFDEDEIHTFIVPKGYHWNDVRAVSENVGVAIVEAFRKVENANSEKLQGIFGDGAWTNKNRLPDRLLKDLLEHFSTKTLSIANCPEDELGQGYEYLIKKFADDSGHTAQEFYTNRTVVHLMTEMLKPESGESIYDPTCGSAGMLISAIAYLKAQGKEWRNVAVYGQEINALTSAIGKMNLFLHGVKDFSIVNGDTLAAPAFIENGKLQQFDLHLIPLANGIALPLRVTNTDAIFWVFLRRAVLIMHSFSTLLQASKKIPADALFCSHTEFFSVMRKVRCVRSLSEATELNVLSALDRTCSITHRWKPAS